MTNTIYTVTECGQYQGAFFAHTLGVFTSLDKAQEAMDKCFIHTVRRLKNATGVCIDTWDMEMMETTILFDRTNKHMVVIDEHELNVSLDSYIF